MENARIKKYCENESLILKWIIYWNKVTGKVWSLLTILYIDIIDIALFFNKCYKSQLIFIDILKFFIF